MREWILGLLLLTVAPSVDSTVDVTGDRIIYIHFAEAVSTAEIYGTCPAAEYHLRVTCVVPYFDFDEDGDVDMRDYGRFQVCFGEQEPLFTEGCRWADADGSGYVDMADADAFMNYADCFAEGVP